MRERQHPGFAGATWCVRVMLTNGEVRHLAGSQGTIEEASAKLSEFEAQRPPQFAGQWYETVEATVIARSQIVEASVVPLR